MSYVAVIVNPISGNKDKDELIAHLSTLPRHKILRTEHPGHATELARRAAAEGAVAVVAAGGDGTVHETAIGLIGGNVPLGIIPLGSGNGLARHLKLPMNPYRAHELILRGHVTRCDHAEVNGLPFFCTMGIGFDAEVSHRFARSGKRGPLTYVKSVIEEIRNYKPRRYTLQLPDSTLERNALLVTVANAAQYGNNARIAPGALMTDAKLNVTLIRAGDPFNTLRAAIELFTGTLRWNPLVETFATTHLTISSPEAEEHPHIHLDGEPMELTLPLTIAVHPGTLPIITPEGEEV
ncbi:MAG: YegS/Rv2252/BmrU family lipid kinase [Bacteroidales bacterium]|nr:YegS/Rv2252/BmrU family lipid kinase [Bacteroidales bacterium]